jgi:hypothetical protein
MQGKYLRYHPSWWQDVLRARSFDRSRALGSVITQSLRKEVINPDGLTEPWRDGFLRKMVGLTAGDADLNSAGLNSPLFL